MKTGRKPIDPALKLIKTGVALPPSLIADLDYLAARTRSSRSAVLVAIAGSALHDVAESFRSSIRSYHESPHDFVLDDVSASFLDQVSKQRSDSDGVMVFLPRSEGGGK